MQAKMDAYANAHMRSAHDFVEASLIAAAAPLVIAGGVGVAGIGGGMSAAGGMALDMKIRNARGQRVSAASTVISGTVSIGFSQTNKLVLAGSSTHWVVKAGWGARMEVGSFATGSLLTSGIE